MCDRVSDEKIRMMCIRDDARSLNSIRLDDISRTATTFYAITTRETPFSPSRECLRCLLYRNCSKDILLGKTTEIVVRKRVDLPSLLVI